MIGTNVIRFAAINYALICRSLSTCVGIYMEEIRRSGIAGMQQTVLSKGYFTKS